MSKYWEMWSTPFRYERKLVKRVRTLYCVATRLRRIFC